METEKNKKEMNELIEHIKNSRDKRFGKLMEMIENSDTMDQIRIAIENFQNQTSRDDYNKGIDYKDLGFRCQNNQHNKCSGHFIAGGKKCSCRCHNSK